MSNAIRIAWLSRHDMTEEQFQALQEKMSEVYGGGEKVDVEVHTVGLVWQSSSDASADTAVNRDKWMDVISKYDGVVGMFPPVAIEALNSIAEKDGVLFGKPIMTPVTTRVMKGGKIAIGFHRWIFL